MSQYLQYMKHRFTSFSAFHHSLRKSDQNYLYVWFVLYVLRLWGSIRSVLTLTCWDNNRRFSKLSNVLIYLQAAGDPGQAFCNFIIVCLLDSTVRKHLFGKCSGKKFYRDEDVARNERERSPGSGHFQRYSEEAQATLENSVQHPNMHDERGRLLGSGHHQRYTEEKQTTLKIDCKDNTSKNGSVQSDTPEISATH